MPEEYKPSSHCNGALTQPSGLYALQARPTSQAPRASFTHFGSKAEPWISTAPLGQSQLGQVLRESVCWGHVEAACWKDIQCGRCLKTGHLTHLCRTLCGKQHFGKPCEDWKTLENMKNRTVSRPCRLETRILEYSNAEATPGTSIF
jgi:hypothetical protein